MNSLILTAGLVAAIAVAPAPTLVRVVVVDNSPSMSGERIATVRKELLDMLRQLPPSADTPVLLIVFHATVEKTQFLTDLRAAETAVSALRGDGDGTRIAPALVRAREELNAYRQSSNLLIMLFTDGEDGDRIGIQQAEAGLDSLFADRTQKGLSQTVFVKRWGNANAELIDRIRARGHSQILDAGELKIESFSVFPQVTLTQVRRSPSDPSQIEVFLVPSLVCRGARPQAPLPPFEFACRNPGIIGKAAVPVDPNGSPQTFSLTMQVPPEAEKTRRLTLTFTVSPLPPPKKGTTFVLPLLMSSIVTVDFQLPQFQLTNQITGAIRLTKRLEWADPLSRLARCPVELSITVTPGDHITGIDRSTTFRVVPAKGIRLEQPDQTISVAGPGTFRVPLTLVVELPRPDDPRGKWDGRLALNLHPLRKPDYLACVPPIVEVARDGVKVPSPVQTKLVADVKTISQPVWVDLVDSMVAFEVTASIQISGPIPPGLMLVLIAPATVRDNVLPANTHLHSGENVVPLHVVCRVTPAKSEKLEFVITPPAAGDAIAVAVERPLALTFQAPPAVAIFHATGPVVEASMLDNQDTVEVDLVPHLFGVDPRALERLPTIRTRALDASANVRIGPGPAFSPQQVLVGLPAPSGQSYFVDCRHVVDLELRSETPTPAILPGQVQVAVQRSAPFKRDLIYVTWVVFGFGVTSIGSLAIRRLREAARPWED